MAIRQLSTPQCAKTSSNAPTQRQTIWLYASLAWLNALIHQAVHYPKGQTIWLCTSSVWLNTLRHKAILQAKGKLYGYTPAKHGLMHSDIEQCTPINANYIALRQPSTG